MERKPKGPLSIGQIVLELKIIELEKSNDQLVMTLISVAGVVALGGIFALAVALS